MGPARRAVKLAKIVEYNFLIFVFDADACIRHRNLQELAAVLADGAQSQTDFSFLGKLQGIRYELHKNLLQFLRVAFDDINGCFHTLMKLYGSLTDQAPGHHLQTRENLPQPDCFKTRALGMGLDARE